MKKSNWYVLTGGPGSGKTTTIDLLKHHGYTTTYESARKYFEDEIKKGTSNEQLRENPKQLQENILKKQIELEAKYTPEQLLFLDRAIPDSFGYFSYHNLSMIPLLQDSNHTHYRKIFFLDPLPVKRDKVRIESNKEAEIIATYTYNAYENLGFEIIRVPLMSRNSRLDFIISHIDPVL